MKFRNKESDGGLILSIKRAQSNTFDPKLVGSKIDEEIVTKQPVKKKLLVTEARKITILEAAQELLTFPKTKAIAQI